jgi:hypothetical protein
MKLIEEFYCTQSQTYGNGSEKILSEGMCKIKTELIRPIIQITNTNGIVVNKKNRFIVRLGMNTFSKEEMLFFEKNYEVSLSKHVLYPDYLVSSLNHIHPLYKSDADITFIEDEDKEYLIIEFNRWEHECQPRGAGEDSLGEDTTYVLGIWEDPLLTDEMIAKIKQQ